MIVLAACAAVLSLPAPASAVDPGVDEYTLRGPDADGEGHVGPDEPVSRPQDLPPAVREELASEPDGETLARLGTARELGAPGKVASGAGDADDEDTSLAAAAGNAISSSDGLLLVAALAVIGAGAFLLARRRPGS